MSDGRPAPAGPPLGPGFFARPALVVAPALIGCVLLAGGAGGRIVEVEAYNAGDPASHSFRGPTASNAAIFGPPGSAYVYRSYGIHWMLNLVCGADGEGEAVLVRAIVPEHGRATIAARRSGVRERDWCRGPGRVGVALAIGPGLDGAWLDGSPLGVWAAADAARVATTPRIGISRAVDEPWRFVEAGSPWLSGPAALNAIDRSA